MPAGAGATGGYAMPPEQRKKCVWRSGLFHRHGLIHGAVPVRKGSGGRIHSGGGRQQVGGGRAVVIGRRLLCGGSAVGDWRLKVDGWLMIRDTGGLSGRPDSRLSALRPESVTREFRPSFPCPGRTYGKQKQVQGLFRQAGWVIRHGTVVTSAGWHRTTRAVQVIRRRSRTSCIVNSDKGLGRFLAGRPARTFPRWV